MWNPPFLPTLLNTCVSCGKLPVKIDERDGQHSESETKKFLNVSPLRSIDCTCGMNVIRFLDRSSVSTKTMFGLLLVPAPGADADCCAPPPGLIAPPVTGRDAEDDGPEPPGARMAATTAATMPAASSATAARRSRCNPAPLRRCLMWTKVTGAQTVLCRWRHTPVSVPSGSELTQALHLSGGLLTEPLQVGG
jgi:hypothetical protein